MNAHGGRPVRRPRIGPLSAGGAAARPASLRASPWRTGGRFRIRIKEPDAVRLISIDEHQLLARSARGSDGRPKSGLRGVAEPGDNAHQPSLAFVPYLMTGDRYFLDEMKYWANFTLLSTFQDSYSKRRGGSAGLLAPNEVRGIGWALRNLADTAAYARQRRHRALARRWSTTSVARRVCGERIHPLGTLFPGRRPEDEQWAP
jgi:hypothetical protein